MLFRSVKAVHVELANEGREVAAHDWRSALNLVRARSERTHLCLKCFGRTSLAKAAALLTMKLVPVSLNEMRCLEDSSRSMLRIVYQLSCARSEKWEQRTGRSCTRMRRFPLPSSQPPRAPHSQPPRAPSKVRRTGPAGSSSVRTGTCSRRLGETERGGR